MKNQDLMEVYNQFHSKGPSAWYGDGREERETILKMGEPWDTDNERWKSIVEIGCGEGDLVKMISDKRFHEHPGGFSTLGIDYSSVAIDFCKKRGLKNTKVVDLNTWEPAADMYDTIVSLDVIYHAEITNDIAILKKFYTALKPQGTLILNLPAFDCLCNAKAGDSGQRNARPSG